jgi:hypothetical protein
VKYWRRAGKEGRPEELEEQEMREVVGCKV